MAGLILKLRPHEELLINGIVIENGDRNARIKVKTEGAHILRLRDAMKPEEATTPLKRAYYVAQLAVAGQMPAEEASTILRSAVDILECTETREKIEGLIADNDFYQVMRQFRMLEPITPASGEENQLAAS